MKACSCESRRDGLREKGYVLLMLLLFLALLSLSFLTLVQRIDFESKRDQEEEMIHRGVQYSRAVRNFNNQFHRYPNSIEELENTNNLRFLRKRYKDPITGKDFRILHLTDMPSYIPVPPPVPAPGQGLPGTSPAEQPQSSAVLNGAAPASTDSSGSGAAKAPGSSQGDPSQNDQNASVDVTRAAQGMVVGVASASKKRSIRVFNRKDHYNQWLFVYDPSANGGLPMTPSQPQLQADIQRNQQQNEQASSSSPAANSGQTNAQITTSPVQAPQ